MTELSIRIVLSLILRAVHTRHPAGLDLLLEKRQDFTMIIIFLEHLAQLN